MGGGGNMGPSALWCACDSGAAKIYQQGANARVWDEGLPPPTV